ncbi:MAG TPA: hypothetical protein VG308_11480, partial [Stellaceae bacterium]|nr:hypothetical protein [Stellaceae bacterium]
RLDEAVQCYRDALQECTQQRAPMQWAMTQNNLGGALLRLGERGEGNARFEAAVGAYNNALSVFIASSAIYYLEMCWENRDRGIALLAKRRGSAMLPPRPPEPADTPLFSGL